jgi:DMSO/TMAO reductase YedYZ molybdopterin-dependent catalytic subunit
MNRLSRRRFVTASAAALAAGWTGAVAGSELGSDTCQTPEGRLVGTLELGAADGAPLPPFGTLLGEGLDARLFTDLSALAPDRLIVPNDRFFVRTARPAALDSARATPDSWAIRIGGLAGAPGPLTLDALAPLARPQGACLLECAGNTNPSTFGLLSAATWDGIPLAAVLDRIRPPRASTRVLVSGVDDLERRSRSSVPGASWIFTRDDLDRAGAFLATRMNGAPLPPDHGAPVRLIVPGWYGCACIKWVDAIDIVPDDAAATTQMIEFARRTHQDGQPALARDFTPAVIDTAAMPVRVEKWIADGRPFYRIVGVLWGGSKPTNKLQIRFRTDEPFVPVTECPLPATTRTWSLWSHVWRPTVARRYQIVLRVDDPAIRTRRLDLFFYVREVRVDEV